MEGRETNIKIDNKTEEDKIKQKKLHANEL